MKKLDSTTPIRGTLSPGDTVRIKFLEEIKRIATSTGENGNLLYEEESYFSPDQTGCCGSTYTVSCPHLNSYYVLEGTDHGSFPWWALEKVVSPAEAKKEERAGYYEDWESLTPLPYEARPWAKKGERYVVVGDDCTAGLSEGQVITLTENNESPIPFFDSEKHCEEWRCLARIPGETYSYEPEDASAPEDCEAHAKEPEKPQRLDTMNGSTGQAESSCRVAPNKVESERQETISQRRKRIRANINLPTEM